MKKIELPEDYALTLQHVNEMQEDDAINLAESLRVDTARMSHILESLQHKHLVTLKRTSLNIIVRLTAKGKKLTNGLWPENPGFASPAF